MDIIPLLFDWDNGNREKCQRHGLSISEIESLFLNQPRIAPDLRHSQQEDRLIAVGQTHLGRPAFVAFTLRHKDGQTAIRPVSARYMHQKEKERYEQADRTTPEN